MRNHRMCGTVTSGAPKAGPGPMVTKAAEGADMFPCGIRLGS